MRKFKLKTAFINCEFPSLCVVSELIYGCYVEGYPTMLTLIFYVWANGDVKSNPALQTPHYYGQFSLSLGKECPYIFSKFNPFNITPR